jgi:hypothetical protein
LIKGLL